MWIERMGQKWEFYFTLLVLSPKVGQNTIPNSIGKNLLNQSANRRSNPQPQAYTLNVDGSA